MDGLRKPNVRIVGRAGRKSGADEGNPAETSSRSYAEAQYRTASERRAEGKALRDDVPREAHTGWNPPKDCRNPVEILLVVQRRQTAGTCPNSPRTDGLVAFRFFSRFRRALWPPDLSHTPRSGLNVQACGDAHLLNFGGFATPERNIIFDINDFDETLPGPWGMGPQTFSRQRGHCGTPPKAVRQRIGAGCHRRRAVPTGSTLSTMRRCARSKSGTTGSTSSASSKNYPSGEIRQRAETANRKDPQSNKFQNNYYPKLVENQGAPPRIKDNPPLIFHPSAKLAPGIRNGFHAALAAYRESLVEHVRVLFDRFHFRDFGDQSRGCG